MTLTIGAMSYFFISCQKTNNPKVADIEIEIPSDWPQPQIPTKYPFNELTVDLGRHLFYDTRLSLDSTISCGSCHKAQFAFADNVPFSVGVEGRLGDRNSNTLTNAVYLPYLNRDGGVPSLDIFSAVPIEEHKEMAFNLRLAAQRMKQDNRLNSMANEAYGRDISPFVLLKSLASFLRTFVSKDSKYDRFIETRDSSILTRAEKNGMILFNGKGQCSTCHNGPLFTDYSFQHNGQVVQGLDQGRGRISNKRSEDGKFRVATLRNIALTAPYMYKGDMATLEEVLSHYARHGHDLNNNKSETLNKIDLNLNEQKDIITFLHTLTDSVFINNPDLLPPTD